MIDPTFTQEVDDNSNKIGVLSNLQTTDKSSLVGSSNELSSQLDKNVT